MIGKFILGVLAGGVTVLGGLVAASLLNPVQQKAAEATEAVPEMVVEPTDDDAIAAPQSPIAPTSTEVTETAPVETAGAEPAEAGVSATAEPTPTEVAEPVTEGDAISTADNAAETAPEATLSVQPAAPVLADAIPPQPPQPIVAEAAPAPAEVPEPTLPQEPTRPPVPDQDAAIAAIDAPAAPVTAPLPLPVAEAEPIPEALAESADTLPQTDIVEPLPEPDGPPPGAMPENELAELPGDDAPTMPGTRPADLPGVITPEAGPSEPEVAPLPDTTGPAATILRPAPGLRDLTEGVITNRLPRIGDAPADDTPSVEDDVVTDTRPIIQNAAVFENTDAKPLFAIVLIDTGADTLDRATLADLPFPVSFALDPLDPATPERAATYRGAGKEVLMLATGIPDGAQAADVEVAFQAMEQGLPEAVAVMELPEKRFQDDRPLASIVVPVVAAQGRGLLTWDQGLNAADQVARREDLPAAVVFRPIDAASEDRTGIRRNLDRAAFRSAQDGRVTVVGRTNDETVAALLEWAVEGRAATVALAPFTAVLTID